MLALRGFTLLLVFQSLGELLARSLPALLLPALQLPGPVVGMLLLALALRWSAVRDAVAGCADFLLSHLSLLFVPVGVGVMTHLALVSQYGFRMLAVMLLSTVAGLAATALLLRAMPGASMPSPLSLPSPAPAPSPDSPPAP